MKVKDYDQMMSHLTEKDYQSNILPKKKPFPYERRLETIKKVDPAIAPQTRVFLRNQLLDDALEAGYINQEQYNSAAKKFMEEVYPTLEKTYEDYDQFIEDDAMGRVTKNYGGRVGFSVAGLALAKEVGNLTLSKARPVIKKLWVNPRKLKVCELCNKVTADTLLKFNNVKLTSINIFFILFYIQQI